MFKVTWINYGELDFASSDFYEVVYSVFSHNIFYETCNGVKHILCCDFGGIFDELHNIVSSDEFQSEVPYEDGCGGDWYLFEYILNDEVVRQAGYIYGLERHEKIVSLIESCAKSILDDERKLLEHKCTNDEMQAIIKQRQELNADFFKIWNNITSKTISIPAGFIKCDNCKSIVHNKYYKNRKYWGRVWLSGAFGDYEVEYDSGECPVCGELNTELPDTGIECQPDDSLFSSDGAVCITAFEEDKDKLYSASELNDLLKHISEDDRKKIIDCQFKLFETSLDDDSGDVYYYITIFKDGNEIGKLEMKYISGYDYRMVLHEDLLKHLSDDDRVKVSDCQFKLSVTFPDAGVGDIFYDLTVYMDGNEIGKIDMQYHSNTYFDLIDMEIKSTDTIPYYTYEMTLYEDSKEGLLGNDNKAFTIEPDENSNKLYTFDELNDLLKHISDEDKIKISGCKFKLFETYPDDDSGDVYYDLKVYKDGIEVGKINMYYHSNTYFDLIDMDVKTTNASPYYTYEIKLYDDLSNKAGFGIKAKWNPFDDSKFRCKKCGKIFCTCGGFFNRKG